MQLLSYYNSNTNRRLHMPRLLYITVHWANLSVYVCILNYLYIFKSMSTMCKNLNNPKHTKKIIYFIFFLYKTRLSSLLLLFLFVCCWCCYFSGYCLLTTTTRARIYYWNLMPNTHTLIMYFDETIEARRNYNTKFGFIVSLCCRCCLFFFFLCSTWISGPPVYVPGIWYKQI